MTELAEQRRGLQRWGLAWAGVALVAAAVSFVAGWTLGGSWLLAIAILAVVPPFLPTTHLRRTANTVLTLAFLALVLAYFWGWYGLAAAVIVPAAVCITSWWEGPLVVVREPPSDAEAPDR